MISSKYAAISVPPESSVFTLAKELSAEAAIFTDSLPKSKMAVAACLISWAFVNFGIRSSSTLPNCWEDCPAWSMVPGISCMVESKESAAAWASCNAFWLVSRFPDSSVICSATFCVSGAPAPMVRYRSAYLSFRIASLLFWSSILAASSEAFLPNFSKAPPAFSAPWATLFIAWSLVLLIFFSPADALSWMITAMAKSKRSMRRHLPSVPAFFQGLR